MLLNFSLKWNYQSAAFRGFLASLHQKQRLSDATIACNGKLYPVHQFVLSMCSDYFNAIFEGLAGDCTNPQRHPVLILRDISSTTLEELLRYMYIGEITVEKQRVAELLITAKALQVKGLSVMMNDSTQATPTDQNTTEQSNIGIGTSPAPGMDIKSGKRFPITKHTSPTLKQNHNNYGELLEMEGPNRRLEPVFELDLRSGSMDQNFDLGLAPQATQWHCSEQPPTQATVPVTQQFCSSSSDPGVTVKLEPGIGTKQTLGCGVVAPTSAQPAQGLHFLPPMVSNRNSIHTSMNPALSPVPRSVESSNIYSFGGVESVKLVTPDHPTSEDTSSSSRLNCISIEQLPTEVSCDETTHLTSSEPSTSHHSMPVITDYYSLLNPENSSVHGAGNIDSAMQLPQPLEGTTTARQLPIGATSQVEKDVSGGFDPSNHSFVNKATLSTQVDSFAGHGQTLTTDCSRDMHLPNLNPLQNVVHQAELVSSETTQHFNPIPSNVEHNSESQPLRWTVPSSVAALCSPSNSNNDQNSATATCALDRRKESFRCCYCSYITRRKNFFLRHQMLWCPHRPREGGQKWRSVAMKIFKCRICKYSTSNRTNLKKHQSRHIEKSLLQCPFCSYSTNQQYWLQTHITKDHRLQSQAGDELLLLPKCSGKETSSCGDTPPVIGSMSQNMDNAESNEKICKDSSSPEENYPCKHCDLCFQKKSCLFEHARIHSDPDCVKCPDCDYRTSLNCSMKKHSIVMSRGSYKCDFCSYTACTEYLLAKHALVDQMDVTPRKTMKSEPTLASCSRKDFETEEYKSAQVKSDAYFCPSCDFNCLQYSKMLKHVSEKHCEGDFFSCDQCDFRAASNRGLKLHLRHHSIKGFYECSQCSYSTMHNSSLQKHRSKHHRRFAIPPKCSDVNQATIPCLPTRTEQEQEASPPAVTTTPHHQGGTNKTTLVTVQRSDESELDDCHPHNKDGEVDPELVFRQEGSSYDQESDKNRLDLLSGQIINSNNEDIQKVYRKRSLNNEDILEVDWKRLRLSLSSDDAEEDKLEPLMYKGAIDHVTEKIKLDPVMSKEGQINYESGTVEFEPVVHEEGGKDHIASRIELEPLLNKEGYNDRVASKVELEPLLNKEGGNDRVASKVELEPLLNKKSGNDRVASKVELEPLLNKKSGNDRVASKVELEPLLNKKSGNDHVASKVELEPLLNKENGNDHVASKVELEPLLNKENGNDRVASKVELEPLLNKKSGNDHVASKVELEPLLNKKSGNDHVASKVELEPLLNKENGNDRVASKVELEPLLNKKSGNDHVASKVELEPLLNKEEDIDHIVSMVGLELIQTKECSIDHEADSDILDPIVKVGKGIDSGQADNVLKPFHQLREISDCFQVDGLEVETQLEKGVNVSHSEADKVEPETSFEKGGKHYGEQFVKAQFKPSVNTDGSGNNFVVGETKTVPINPRKGYDHVTVKDELALVKPRESSDDHTAAEDELSLDKPREGCDHVAVEDELTRIKPSANSDDHVAGEDKLSLNKHLSCDDHVATKDKSKRVGSGGNRAEKLNNTSTRFRFFKCKECEYTVKAKYCLLEHLRLHAEPNRLKCPSCDYRTSKPERLTKHMSAISGCVLQCSSCSYSACSEALIAKHMMLDKLNQE